MQSWRERWATGREMMAQPVELLVGVAETLPTFARSHCLLVITKGDPADQQRQLTIRASVQGADEAARSCAGELVVPEGHDTRDHGGAIALRGLEEALPAGGKIAHQVRGSEPQLR